MRTPQQSYPKLASTLGLNSEVWLKREDQHHYGSHKGRSIPLMIAEYAKQGVTDFVISSSGNAALAAAQAVARHNRSAGRAPLSLLVFVGERIASDKLAAFNTIHDTHITIQKVTNPKQQAFQMDKNSAAKWLRQSTDDTALAGYHELAGELAKIANLAAVFIPTSSGTTAQGLFDGFQALGLNPQIHIVQTEECHPMVDGALTAAQTTANPTQPPLGKGRGPTPPPLPEGGVTGGWEQSPSLATAIVDKIAHRKIKILEAIKKSAGAGWVATNTQIVQAQKLLKQTTGVDVSPNSALSVVGLTQAIENGWKWTGPVICLITGK